ncbi:hypothetical protein [Winogradskyella sp. SYSU M77433]|uniref:hypothetical protein n=1 Tax=Winogradskyella sp. SYSU M77433 TaxID=3042722 RepID=UPI00247FF7BA|nr:hypothetical protein [Winogradskyella sp. SYSU M77433]MDH7911761.1 hypothetical protein [Winogradskyella sp. SYSU M77433]|tara:strand:- start:5120 stop:5953 length:834 start_codon:yes stop_codon:yes gene_type:complete
MKKVKILFSSLITLAFFACGNDDVSDTTFDNVNGQTLVSFQGATSDLAVTIDDVGTVEVVIESSTVSSSDRTITVTLDEENSTANAENYTIVNPVVTIPANEYFGILTINGVDTSVETTPETIVLNMDDSSTDLVYGTTTHTVNIFQVCPIPDDYFVGSYLIEQTSAQVDGYTLSHGTIVEVSASGPTQRTFLTENYPSYCSGTFRNFYINLVCNEFVVPLNGTSCACSSFDDWFGPATVNEMYDTSDDTVLNVTFTDDVQGDCSSPSQTTYQFTKQ